MNQPNKKYGLQLPKSKLKNAFQQDDDQDDNDDSKFNEEEQDSGHIDYIKQKMGTNTKVEMTFNKALKDDPTAFEYDSVYDSIKNDREKKQQQLIDRDSKKESRYIAGLMQQSLQKKKDYERVKEYKIQKEREKEGDQFKDKDVYVTSAYKKKLEQDRLQKELEEKEDLEQQSRKKDLNSFQKNMLTSMYDKSASASTSSDHLDKDKIIERYRNYNSNNNNKYDNRDKSNSNSYNNNYNSNKKRYYEPQYEKRQDSNKPTQDEYERYNSRRNDEKSIQAARERYFERISLLKN